AADAAGARTAIKASAAARAARTIAKERLTNPRLPSPYSAPHRQMRRAIGLARSKRRCSRYRGTWWPQGTAVLRAVAAVRGRSRASRGGRGRLWPPRDARDL